ncbi:MAG: hypothetical protein Q9209_000442 [Squamulea sp. 1 TL-2023]
MLPFSFPPPKKYTNALLRPHDITALIRDTEAHEKVLFRYAPSLPASSKDRDSGPRQNTAYASKRGSENLPNNIDFPRPSRQRSIVTTLQGTDLREQLWSGGAQPEKERGEVNVDILLKGAERLCAIYPMSGAREKISSLRSRFEQLAASVTRYEARVTKSAAQLTKRNRRADTSGDRDDTGFEGLADMGLNDEGANQMPITTLDLEREEQEIRELERKKRTLEDRVNGMERDLGGLLR